MIEAIHLLKLEIVKTEKIVNRLREAKLLERATHRKEEIRRLQRIVDLLELERKVESG